MSNTIVKIDKFEYRIIVKYLHLKGLRGNNVTASSLSVSGQLLSTEVVENIKPEEPIGNEGDYQEIQLTDGSTALIDTNLLKLIESDNEQRVKEVHEKAKLKTNFICTYDDCRKSFTSHHQLSVHTRLHTGVRPYSCIFEGCDKSFVTSYSLKTHTRTHTGEKPYGCIICFKHFKTAGDLQKHIRTHTGMWSVDTQLANKCVGEKPFKCPIEGCEKSFSTSNIRKVHIRSHTGERPYSCRVSGCGKAFSSATNYKNHIRIHSGEKPYCCSVEGCDKRFTEYSSLYKHKFVHNPAKFLHCPYNGCYQTFKSEGTLKQHERTVHNIIYIKEESSTYKILPVSTS